MKMDKTEKTVTVLLAFASIYLIYSIIRYLVK